MASIVRYLKYGEESNYAEESKNIDETVDPEEASLDPETEDKLIYEGMGGLDRTVGLGVYTTGGDIVMPVDDKATGWFWKWALGGYSVKGTSDGSSAPYTHTFSPKFGGLMTSFTAKVGKDIFEHIFLGNVVEEIEVEMEDEWATMTVSTLGAKDKKGTLDGEISYTDGELFTAPMARLKKEGEDVSPDVNSLTMTIETGANVEDQAGFGSRFPSKATRGSMVVNLEMELTFDNTDDLIDFWGGNDGPSVDTVEEFKYELNLGDSMKFLFPRLIYNGSEQPAEGREGITQTLTARALYDDTNDTGPISVELTNDRESYEVK